MQTTNISWAILHDPTRNIGAVYQFPRVYSTRHNAGNFFWNREQDTKLYFQVTAPPTVGARVGYQLRQVPFQANSTNWQQRGLALLRTLPWGLP